MSAHLADEDDALATVRPILSRVADFHMLLQPGPADDFRDLRNAEATGRPLGPSEFVTGLEAILRRRIARRAPGRKPTRSAVSDSQPLRLL